MSLTPNVDGPGSHSLLEQAQVLIPYWNKIHISICESSQLEGSCVGD